MLLALIEYFYIRVRMLNSCLVYFATHVEYSFLFVLAACFMIYGKLTNNLSIFRAHDRPTITYIGDMEQIPI